MCIMNHDDDAIWGERKGPLDSEIRIQRKEGRKVQVPLKLLLEINSSGPQIFEE